MAVIRRVIHATRFGQLHLRSAEGQGVPLVLLHGSPRCGGMWESLQSRLSRPSFAPDRLGYGFSDAPPWALSVEQYAQSTLDALRAAGLTGAVDVLGVNAGAIEALELAQQMRPDVRRVGVFALPLLTAEEQQRQLEKPNEQPLKPVAEGSHLLGVWRGAFAFRQPPYDLVDVQQRFVEHLLAPNPGALFRAVCSYPLDKKLRSLKIPLTVFAPRDDLYEHTERVKPLLKANAEYVDLPTVGQDPFLTAVEQMVELVNRHLPAE